MTSSSTFLTYIVGTLLLVHSGYSAYEYHSLTSASTMPIDIIVETIVAIVIIIFGAIGLIANEPNLSLENKLVDPSFKFLKPIHMNPAMSEFEKLGVSDYSQLDNRLDFIDIVAKRAEYTKWVESTD